MRNCRRALWHCLFIATPHYGAWVPMRTSRARAVVDFVTRMSAELSELEENSEKLRNINDAMAEIVQRNGIAVLSLGETLPTPIPPSQPKSLLSVMLVPPASANPGFGLFELVDKENHLNICKPRNKKLTCLSTNNCFYYTTNR